MKISNSRECECDKCGMKIEATKGIRIGRATYIHEECPKKVKIVDVPTLKFEDEDADSHNEIIIQDVSKANDTLEDR